MRDVSFSVAHGEIVALLGPNGAGKTTTLEILEGFRTRDGGEVQVLGLDPGGKSALRDLRGRTGLVLQDIAVEPYLTVRETITRQAGYYRGPRDAPGVISLAGLAGLERRKVRALSGGQKRRLDLARPLRTAGTTILLTTHDMAEAQALAPKALTWLSARFRA